MAVVSLPLVAFGRKFGVVVFRFGTDRAFDPPARAFLLTVAAQAAQALDRAMVFSRAVAARRRLEILASIAIAVGGRLIVEVGYDQDDRVAALAAGHGWTLSHVRQDLQAITRTLIFTL